MVVVLWLLCKKYCRRCRDKLWSPVTIVPPPTTHHQPYASTTGASSPMPIVEYSRISYTRQGSRLSSSSRDSGQFGIASNSPLLLTPESGSEFAELSVMVPDNQTERAHQRSPTSKNVQPVVATTYVNDDIVLLRRPTTADNNHHPLPSSSTTGPLEFIPLQPIRHNHQPNEVSAIAGKFPAANDDEDETHVTDSLVKSRQNGGHDIAMLRQNSDYIPHEFMKM